jgi:hypothetical protein
VDDLSPGEFCGRPNSTQSPPVFGFPTHDVTWKVTCSSVTPVPTPSRLEESLFRLSGIDSRLKAFFSRAGGPAERGAIDSWSKRLSTFPAASCLS